MYESDNGTLSNWCHNGWNQVKSKSPMKINHASYNPVKTSVIFLNPYDNFESLYMVVCIPVYIVLISTYKIFSIMSDIDLIIPPNIVHPRQ